MSIANPQFASPKVLVLFAAATLAGCGTPVIVPGNDASPYTYSGTSAALDGKQTPVFVYGDPFPGTGQNALLPAGVQSMVNGAALIDR